MKRDDVLIGQINLQRGTTGTCSLIKYLSQRLQTNLSSFLIALQEPPVKEGKITGFGSLGNLYYDRSSPQRPRAAIIASKDLSIWPSPKYTTGDVVTVLWKLRDTEIFFVSTYM